MTELEEAGWQSVESLPERYLFRVNDRGIVECYDSLRRTPRKLVMSTGLYPCWSFKIDGRSTLRGYGVIAKQLGLNRAKALAQLHKELRIPESEARERERREAEAREKALREAEAREKALREAEAREREKRKTETPEYWQAIDEAVAFMSGYGRGLDPKEAPMVADKRKYITGKIYNPATASHDLLTGEI